MPIASYKWGQNALPRQTARSGSSLARRLSLRHLPPAPVPLRSGAPPAEHTEHVRCPWACGPPGIAATERDEADRLSVPLGDQGFGKRVGSEPVLAQSL